MKTNSRVCYPSLTLNKPLLPARSKLYQLQPIGITTSLTESLTSFITRLAQAHCVSVDVLVSREIIPLLEKIFLKKCGSRGIISLYERAQALNGSGDIAIDFVQALEKLTYNFNLRFLTLLGWNKVVCSKGLFRNHRAWCPRCYEEWRQSNQIIYDPLIWCIGAINACHYHNELLCHSCPACKKSLPVLASKPILGYCSNCGNWLGFLGNNACNPSEWDTWVSNTLGELLSCTHTLSILSKSGIKESIISAINLETNGNITDFSRLIGESKSTVWGWYKGETLPTFKTLLKISYYFNSSLLSFLGQPSETDKVLRNKVIEIKKTRKVPNKFSLIQIENMLTENSDDPRLSSLSIQEVAKIAGCHRRTLLRRCPSLCLEINDRRRCHHKNVYRKNLKKCCAEVQRITRELHAQGQYPTEARVSKLISKPGYFRYKEVRAIFKQARKDLGLETSNN